MEFSKARKTVLIRGFSGFYAIYIRNLSHFCHKIQLTLTTIYAKINLAQTHYLDEIDEKRRVRRFRRKKYEDY